MPYLVTSDLTEVLETVAGFTELDNGMCTISFPNGEVVSVQPGGEIQHRVAGTQGVYEQCELDGSIAVYNPTGDAPIIFAYINGNR